MEDNQEEANRIAKVRGRYPKRFDGRAPRPLPSQGGFILRRINANSDTLDLVFLSDRNLRVPGPRSEEHTSELQSRLHLVCRLLLEKKKKSKLSHNTYITEHR